MFSSQVDQIKERLGITDVVSSYVSLERAGSNLKAKCPFHNEKTPSFFVSPSRNSFYCFGCGVKGDIFTFVEQFEGLDFPGTLRILAERAGVPLSFESKTSRDERTRLFDLLEAATVYFQETLNSEKKAHSYLADRGLTDKTIKIFRLGYAQNEWRDLYEYLKNKGFTDAEIEKAGLIKKADNTSSGMPEGKTDRYYNRFRGRIMFPITDSSGRVIAFSGRLFPEGGEAAKYVNSPETVLFNKSKVLYGFDKAKHQIRKANFSIVVEGQMDILMSYQAGYTNTVALSGTALTSEHIKAIKRLSDNIVLAFDTDDAGIASAGKSAKQALASGMDVKVADMPRGVDPADLVRKNPESLKAAVRSSKHIINFYLDLLSAEKKDERSFGKAVTERVLPFISQISNKIDQAHFITQVAEKLKTSDDVVREELSKLPAEVISDQEIGTKQQMGRKLSRREALERKLRGIILWQENEKKPIIDTKKLRNQIKIIVSKTASNEFLTTLKSDQDEALFIAEVGYDDVEVLKQDVQELLSHLEEEYLKNKFENVLKELKQAELEKNSKRVLVKLKECKELSEQINALQTG